MIQRLITSLRTQILANAHLIILDSGFTQTGSLTTTIVVGCGQPYWLSIQHYLYSHFFLSKRSPVLFKYQIVYFIFLSVDVNYLSQLWLFLSPTHNCLKHIHATILSNIRGSQLWPFLECFPHKSGTCHLSCLWTLLPLLCEDSWSCYYLVSTKKATNTQ